MAGRLTMVVCVYWLVKKTSPSHPFRAINSSMYVGPLVTGYLLDLYQTAQVRMLKTSDEWVKDWDGTITGCSD